MAAQPGEPAIDIEQLIPHRPPMRLVEELHPIDDETGETSSIVRERWPTAEAGYVRTVMLIELLAQSAAAFMGWRERPGSPEREAAGPIREAPKPAASGGAQLSSLGLLVGVPEAHLADPLVPVGLRLRCSVRITRALGGYCAFDGTVRDDSGKTWLEASIQAFRPTVDEIARLSSTGKKES